MKVALIMGNYVKQGYPPLGILYLASYLKKYRPECNVTVFDIFPEHDVIINGNFDLVGFSCLSIQYPDVCEYAQELIGRCSCRFLVGGVHITLTHTIPDWADWGIIGEGEETLFELVSTLMGLSGKSMDQIDGLIHREGKNKIIENKPRKQISNLDQIPIPAWDLIDMEYYLKPNNVFGTVIGRGLSLMTSRGCCYKCQFCASSNIWETIRFHSAEYIADMIQHVVEKYQVKYLWLADDHFALKKERLKKLAQILTERNIHVKMGINCRIESYDDEMAQLLQCLGVECVALGLESGSDRILHTIKNGNSMTVAQEESVIRKMVADGLQVHGMFMVNIPGEDMEDLQRTVDFVHRLPLAKVSVAVALPYYGTPWWNLAVAQGIVDDDPNDFDQLRSYNMKTLQKNRPTFKTGIPREVLEETYQSLEEYAHSLFYFNWRDR